MTIKNSRGLFTSVGDMHIFLLPLKQAFLNIFLQVNFAELKLIMYK